MKSKIKKISRDLDMMKEELHTSLEKFWSEAEGAIGEKESSLRERFNNTWRTFEKSFMDSNIDDIKEYYSRLLSDMREYRFLTTDWDPSEEEISQMGEDIDVVISCRGGKGSKELHPTHISSFEKILKGNLAECYDKDVIIYIHGYNVDRKIALREGENLFKRLRAGAEGYKFILFTWPGDSGLMKFGAAQNYAEYAGEMLYRMSRRLLEEYGVRSVSLVAHSLGAHVALRSANLMGRRERYKNVLLLGPAIEENMLSKSSVKGRYWYPHALDKIENLDVVYSKTDFTLEVCFSLYELGKPLGSNLSRYSSDPRIRMHDLTPMNCHIKEIAVHSHLQYWETDEQVDFYRELLIERREEE